MLRGLRSKIGLKIGILVVIQIVFVISSFSILSYYELQETHLGNSINIAGKNRYLTSNLLLQISEYFSHGGNDYDSSKIKTAMNQLESNILTLKQGGMVSDIGLRPLPPRFLEGWETIYQEWVSLKGILTNSMIQPNEATDTGGVELPSIEALQATIQSSASSLLNSSDTLVTKLGEYSRVSSQNSLILQGVLAILNIAVAIIVLYLVLKILRPIFDLTLATSEVSKGDLAYRFEAHLHSVLTRETKIVLSSIPLCQGVNSQCNLG